MFAMMKVLEVVLIVLATLTVAALWVGTLLLRLDISMMGAMRVMGWREWWRKWRSGQCNSPWHVKQPWE